MSSTTPKTEWSGIYYDGVSAVPHRVTVQIQPSGIQIIAQSGSQLSWRYCNIRQTQGKYSGEEVRFERGSGICEILTVSDIAILQSLHALAPDLATHFHNPARRQRRLLLTILAGLVSLPLLWVTFTWGIPWLSGPITTLIPIAWEKELGQYIATELAPQEKRCADPKIIESLDTIVSTLSTSVQSTPYTFHISVVDSPTVNALAAPGGQILVFRGLLESTETAEEMAGVLAHEMQHILQRHGMRLLVQQASMGVVVGALSGDVSGIMTFGLQAAHILQTLSYNRDVEEQADKEGVVLLLRAGIDPQGMLNFFRTIKEKLYEKGKTPQHITQYLQTHPSTNERIQRLQKLIPPTFNPATSLLPKTNWVQIRELCGSRTKETT
ncbi:M48 family metallopeptidase [Nitrospira sp. M1]